MKRLLLKLFRRRKVWPYCTKTYSFPPWPNRDVSMCGSVNWTYSPKEKVKT